MFFVVDSTRDQSNVSLTAPVSTYGNTQIGASSSANSNENEQSTAPSTTPSAVDSNVTTATSTAPSSVDNSAQSTALSTPPASIASTSRQSTQTIAMRLRSQDASGNSSQPSVGHIILPQKRKRK